MSFSKTRRLAPATIIPAHLYVKRAADRQIRSVIEQMGRPGYVLVARQMGKTNLLLNARREMQDLSTIFVYFDLSQKFETERNCFRSIIDTALAAHVTRFSDARSDIAACRTLNLSPQQEHETELRHLLAKVPHRLVVVLDEIDSLTGSTFSDIIFAQIRSVYFAGRTNYPDFNKLTYLLSGVVEPSDIIKDPRISPFNIGEKIYLDDFSQNEVLIFLENAQLDLDVSSVERLWYWTGGNPRILWDVCSQLELDSINGFSMDIAHIDRTVQYLYLDDFARAPVDHIRQLVEQDDTLREALSLIKEGKANQLDEASKTKLYLTGIISSRLRSPLSTIKNQIIYHALSDTWLQEVAVRKKGLLFLALEQFSKARYKEALVLYTDYLRHNKDTTEANAGVLNKIAWCHRYIGQSQKALDIIKENPADKSEDQFEYFEQKLIQAFCCADVGRPDIAVELFREIVAGNRNDYTCLTAMINLGGLLQNDADPAALDQSQDMFLSVISNISSGKSKLQTTDKKKLLTIARWNYANILYKREDTTNARKQLNQTLEDCSAQDRPVVQLFLSQISDPPQKETILLQAAKTIIDQKIVPHADLRSRVGLNLKLEDMLRILSEMWSIDPPTFNNLADWVVNFPPINGSKAELYLSLGMHQISKIDAASIFFQRALESDPTPFIKLRVHSILSLLTGPEVGATSRDQVISLVQDFSTGESFDHIELRAVTECLFGLNRLKQYTKALRLANHLDSLRPTISKDLLPDFAAIYYVQMLIYSQTSNLEVLRTTADKTLALIEESSISLSRSSMEKREFEAIRKFAERHCTRRQFLINKPVYDPLIKMPRNALITVKYKDGSIHRDKFKRLSDDIVSGRCEIVSDS